MPLGKNADAGDYVDDFKKSKAPQFKGKSKKKRRQMAIAAYLSNKNELANFIREVIKEADPKKGTGKKPKGSGRRLYTDENPKDTVSVKFSSRQDIVDTLGKSSFKSKSHARQSQVINLIHQRTRAAYGRAKDPAVKKRLKSALDYITSRKEASKRKTKRMNKNELAQLVKEVLHEEATIDRYITVLSVIDGKRNLDNDQISTIFTDDVHGTFYIYTNEEGEYENEKPITKKQALDYIKYYNARLKGDTNTEERLGAELGVLGIESELRFNHGEIKGDPTVFSANENYKDGKVKGKSRPGRVKKSGASCKGSVSSLRAKAKKYGGEKGKMYHWCANMKGGKKK